jgi:hypothetical protein
MGRDASSLESRQRGETISRNAMFWAGDPDKHRPVHRRAHALPRARAEARRVTFALAIGITGILLKPSDIGTTHAAARYVAERHGDAARPARWDSLSNCQAVRVGWVRRGEEQRIEGYRCMLHQQMPPPQPDHLGGPASGREDDQEQDRVQHGIDACVSLASRVCSSWGVCRAGEQTGRDLQLGVLD